MKTIAGVASILMVAFVIGACSDEASTLEGSAPDASSRATEDASPPVPSTTTSAAPSATGTGSNAPDASGPPPVTGTTAQEICVAEINKWRATENLPPLQRWSSAETCSDGEAKSDAETGTAHGAFGRCTENAQNECPGWPGKPEQMIAGCLKMMWEEKFGSGEKGHYLNMKSTSFSKVACGFHVTSGGKVWAVQNFRP